MQYETRGERGICLQKSQVTRRRRRKCAGQIRGTSKTKTVWTVEIGWLRMVGACSGRVHRHIRGGEERGTDVGRRGEKRSDLRAAVTHVI